MTLGSPFAVAQAGEQSSRTSDKEPIKVYLAKKFITMDPSQPEATAVAVRQGRIVSVGSLETLQPWLRQHPHQIDQSLKDKTVLPGFIDNHVHPALGAILLQMDIIAAEDWNLPSKRIPGVQGREAYLARLQQLVASKKPDAPVVSWGWHPLYHGEITRADLDRVSEERPIVLWHRSFHEVVANSAALKFMGLEASAFEGDHYVDFAKGHFAEHGIRPVIQGLKAVILNPERFLRGLKETAELYHQGGVTSVADMAIGIFDFDMELQAFQAVLNDDSVPFRTYIVSSPLLMQQKWGDKTFEKTAALEQLSTDRLIFLKQIKTFADGAFVSQLMQMDFPGYIDGHQGKWIVPPEKLADLNLPYWQNGFGIHIHVNGDKGVDASLDMVEALLLKQPRWDHRVTLHHFGLSTQDQITRAAKLGVELSVNGYYLYQFGDKFAEVGLGHDRASQMTRVGSAVREGIKVSLHSDLPIAPVEPLVAVSSLVTRKTRAGRVMAPAESLTLDQALRAITIDAAYVIKQDHQIGSIEAGKRADFTVLEQDPYAVDPEAIGQIGIWGTVFEGRLFPRTP